ncbi:MAG TPA: DUF6390 family protein [Candidatus Nanoarchaeia archaeon]|nr:DUF6390 family protein [Candidatus Nanoarchaeia archaeon]
MSYITNSLHFCGPMDSNREFLRYIEKKDNEDDVRGRLKRFEGLYPYLSSIAKMHGKDFLDPEVVEAYWFGNGLLDAFTDEDMKGIIEKLVARGLPKSIGQSLIEKMKPGFVPHHNFNVFYVGVGRVTGSVETTLANMDNCRSSWGSVIEILGGNKMLVKTTTLRKEKGRITLLDDNKVIAYLPEMIPSVRKRDLVALHWGFAPLIITRQQAEAIDFYTKNLLGIIHI